MKRERNKHVKSRPLILHFYSTSSFVTFIWGEERQHYIDKLQKFCCIEFKVRIVEAHKRLHGSSPNARFEITRSKWNQYSWTWSKSWPDYRKEKGFEVVFAVDIRGDVNRWYVGKATLGMRNFCSDFGVRNMFCRLLMNWKYAKPSAFEGEPYELQPGVVRKQTYNLERPKMSRYHHNNSKVSDLNAKYRPDR
ncbi:uncharacterized protein LOC135498972 [Lineus longissimus]|uniref:uncharacterized protein LOC135498972 n=1 Tax=Lineus longissimus TaxID=88925 RepID=UPI00315D8C2D